MGTKLARSRHMAMTLLLLWSSTMGVNAMANTPKEPNITVETVVFEGWQNAIKISNSDVDVIVVPAIGRIMYYGLSGQQNWLHVNPAFAGITLPEGQPRQEQGKAVYTNFGGDRIWPYQEDEFETITGSFRPADFYIDGLAWQADIHPNGVTMTSPVSPFSGIQVIRTLSLSDQGARLDIDQTMVKQGMAQNPAIEPVKVTLWNLTVIENHDAIVFELANAALFPENDGLMIPDWGGNNHARENIVRKDNLAALVATGEDNFQKIGGNATGWIAGLRGNYAMIETFDYDANASYPDGGTSVTTFMTQNTGELECLSPHTALKLGESLTFNLQWHIVPLTAESLEAKMLALQAWHQSR